VRWIFAAFAAVAITSGAVGARAQEACAIPEEVPASLFESGEASFIDTLGAGFPMPVAACDKVVKTALKTCQKAVSGAARCWKGVGKGLAKAGKTVCREQGGSEGLCLEFIEGEVAGLAAAVEASTLAGLAACETEATELRILCIGL